MVVQTTQGQFMLSLDQIGRDVPERKIFNDGLPKYDFFP
jgi:hypothetical protein